MSYASGGLGSSYIAQRVQREPLDQTNLKNGIDAVYGGSGGTFQKLPGGAHHQGSGGTWVEPSSPTWQPLKLYFWGLPPRVL
jgi:hypothetical protein